MAIVVVGSVASPTRYWKSNRYSIVRFGVSTVNPHTFQNSLLSTGA